VEDSRSNAEALSVGNSLVSVEMVYMMDLIWGFSDISELEDQILVDLFGPYVTVIKYTGEGKNRIEHTKRMPAALAIEEVLRSLTNGVLVRAAKIVDLPPGKWDMSASCPIYNPWSKLDIEDDA
jgi:hypothetical protein